MEFSRRALIVERLLAVVLLAAALGVAWAESRSSLAAAVRDEAVLSAVRKHTLGDLVMSPLDKAVYVADACSADRSHPGVAETRALAFGDLDAAFERCLADKLSDALRRRAWLHPLTIELWNSLAAR